MALIKCPECGKMISGYAERCPKCGLTMAQIKEKDIALAKLKEQQEAEATAKLKAQQEAEAAAKLKEQQEAEAVATATNSPSSIDEDTTDDSEDYPWYVGTLPWLLCGVLTVAIILILCSRHNNNTSEVAEVADSSYVSSTEEYEEVPEVMEEDESEADEDARAMLIELINQIVNKNNEIYENINKEYFDYISARDCMDNILRNYCSEGQIYWYTQWLEELDREEASGEGPGRSGDGPDSMTDFFLHVKDEDFAIWDEVCTITDWEIKGLCTVGDNGAAIVSYTKQSCYNEHHIHSFIATYRLERSNDGKWKISEMNGYSSY